MSFLPQQVMLFFSLLFPSCVENYVCLDDARHRISRNVLLLIKINLVVLWMKFYISFLPKFDLWLIVIAFSLLPIFSFVLPIGILAVTHQIGLKMVKLLVL